MGVNARGMVWYGMALDEMLIWTVIHCSGHDTGKEVVDCDWGFGDGQEVSSYCSIFETFADVILTLGWQRQQIPQKVDGVLGRECRLALSGPCFSHGCCGCCCEGMNLMRGQAGGGTYDRDIPSRHHEIQGTSSRSRLYAMIRT